MRRVRQPEQHLPQAPAPGGTATTSVTSTLRRVLIALVAGELDRAVGAWLREHAGCDADGWAIALDGKDLRGSWHDDGRLVLFSAMTHRTERQDAVVLGQITVPEGTTETTQVRTMLGEMDIAGALVTADAAHTRRHWGIENLEHRPRDTVWREDDQQAHHGNGPRAMATLRNLVLGLFAIHGITKIKQTVQSIGRNRSAPSH